MSKDNTHKHHGANSLHSFMWGAIIGSGITYVLSHKKGRQILKDVSEQGIEGLRGILDSDNIAEWKETVEDHIHKNTNENLKRASISYSPPAPKKRLFKGAKKK